ncbi:MAG: hypothetical protein D6712_21545, partial [Chloroflexi bacterium]
ANQPTEAPTPEELITEYEGIPVSFDDRGFPRLGDPTAPVEVVEISSFDCPHCREFHETVTPSLIERARAGDIVFVYVPLWGTGGIPNGEGAARAALCAGEQGRFWEMHSILFHWQGQFPASPFSTNRLTAGIENLGLDVGAFNACFNSEKTNNTLEAAREFAISKGEEFTGTPSVYINGVLVSPATLDEITTAIDEALARVRRDEATEEPEMTPEATVEAVVVEETEEPPVEETEEPMMEMTEEPEMTSEATVEAAAVEVTEEPEVTPAVDATEEPMVEATEEPEMTPEATQEAE